MVLASLPLLAKTVYLVEACLKSQTREVSCVVPPPPFYVYSAFIFLQYCAIPCFARLESSEAKLQKARGLLDGG